MFFVFYLIHLFDFVFLFLILIIVLFVFEWKMNKNVIKQYCPALFPLIGLIKHGVREYLFLQAFKHRDKNQCRTYEQ